MEQKSLSQCQTATAKERQENMGTLQISGQWYVVRWEDEKHETFTIIDGPFSEEWWAVSAARLREVQDGLHLQEA